MDAGKKKAARWISPGKTQKPKGRRSGRFCLATAANYEGTPVRQRLFCRFFCHRIRAGADVSKRFGGFPAAKRRKNPQN
jgi:hypothetical protein